MPRYSVIQIFQSLDVFPGPNTSFQSLRLIHHSKSISRLSFAEVRKAVWVVVSLNKNCSITACVYKAGENLLTANYRRELLCHWLVSVYTLDMIAVKLNSEGIWLSGKTLDCRPRDCEFDPLSLQLNY